MTTKNPPLTVAALQAALVKASDAAMAAAEQSVKIAVQYVAALTREAYPGAQRVELVASEGGDWLLPVSVDGDVEKAEKLEDGLAWATSCIYDANRPASPALHSGDGRRLSHAERLYIDIAEALNDK